MTKGCYYHNIYVLRFHDNRDRNYFWFIIIF